MILPKNRTGFTLIELLVVLGILAILFAIVLVAINPPHQFALARNGQRRSDVNATLNAIHQLYIESKSKTLPAGIDITEREICKAAVPATTCKTLVGKGGDTVDLCALVTTYIAELPSDPSNGTKNPCRSGGDYGTGYTVQAGTDNRTTVRAPLAEEGESIIVTR